MHRSFKKFTKFGQWHTHTFKISLVKIIQYKIQHFIYSSNCAPSIKILVWDIFIATKINTMLTVTFPFYTLFLSIDLLFWHYLINFFFNSGPQHLLGKHSTTCVIQPALFLYILKCQTHISISIIIYMYSFNSCIFSTTHIHFIYVILFFYK
jgi:hypothetical protein